jgi:hypothetical protein
MGKQKNIGWSKFCAIHEWGSSDDDDTPWTSLMTTLFACLAQNLEPKKARRGVEKYQS